MRFELLAGAATAVVLGVTSPAMAGNVLLTGHDNDFHCGGGFGDANACSALGAEASYVTSGSTNKALPILVIDNGTELSSALTHDGFSVTTVSVSAVTAADFDPTKFSAFAVASVSTCGGCDNPTTTGATLATFSSAIASFFNAGGGILGMTAATGGTFAYVPQAASGSPIGGSSGFVATAAGLADIPGFAAVNGDETHNIFTSFAGYTVAETSTNDGGAPVTIFITGATITGTHIGTGPSVPEPVSLSLLGAGLFGLGVARRSLRS